MIVSCGMWLLEVVIGLFVCDYYIFLNVYVGCFEVFIVWMDFVVIDEMDFIVMDWDLSMFNLDNGLLYSEVFLDCY